MGEHQSPNGKYPSNLAFHRARFQRDLLRSVLAPLAHWTPLVEPADGYSLIIGSLLPLTKLLKVNLALLSMIDRSDLREVIIVNDSIRTPPARAVEQELRRGAPDLPLRFIYYTPAQAALLNTIGWAWCSSWLSWALGVGAVRTRHALLHDLDALILHPDALHARYRHIRRSGDRFVGVRFYEGNGIRADDGLAVTFELMLDAAFVRGRYRPIDLFNRVRTFRGRPVELDTFLDVQARRGSRSSVLPMVTNHMVHPSQLICQYANLAHARRRYRPPANNSLPLMPYFFHVAGDPDVLRTHRAAFDEASDVRVRFLDHTMDASLLNREHADWLARQARRLEKRLYGRVRPEVTAYFDSVGSFLARRDARGAASRAQAGPRVHPGQATRADNRGDPDRAAPGPLTPAAAAKPPAAG